MAEMTDEHKAALAKGRRQARAVKAYLAALETGRKRGPKMTPDKLRKRIDDARAQIDETDDPAKKLDLIQQRMDDEERLAELVDEPDTEALEQEFVDVAAEYGERKGISYAAWREFGVPAATLKAAGVPRTRRS